MISADGFSSTDETNSALRRLRALPQHDLLTMAGDWLGELAPWRSAETLGAIAALPAETVLASLFVFGEQVTESEAREDVPGPLIDLLLDAGVLTESSGKLSAEYCLVRVDGMALITSWRAAGRDRGTYGPWICSDSLTLARIIASRRDVRRCLDLGCGTGVLGLVAARNGAAAVGVDVSPECVAAARLNAHVNGLADRLTAQVGDILSLSVGDRYDLVVSNPPCLPLRRGALGWLAGEAGLDGLDFFWELVSRLPALLTEDGEALIQAAAYGDERGPFLVPRLTEELRRHGLAGRLLVRPTTPVRWPAFASRDENQQLTGPLGEEVREYVARIGATHYYGFVLSLRPGDPGLAVGRFR
ncbi:methyltransferase [Streptomyces sp. NPDC017979]|uniref:methyltransferase n=1 Tax=Streptomyces sp. NPDC017979 TaxID=3365024 RepID=UPI0037B6082D